MTRVLVFGVFDFFHPGHLGFLRLAGRHGNELIVSVARDLFVSSIKRRKPMFSEDERLARISELPFVDFAVLSDEITGEYSVIKEYMPSVICFGHDQNELENHCEKWLAVNDIPVKTQKLPVIPHIRKDYAFLSWNGKCSAVNSGLSGTVPEFEEGMDRRFVFSVYDRQGEMKAAAGWNFTKNGGDLILVFPKNSGLPCKYSSLIRETACFYKYYTGTEDKKINISMPAISAEEITGFDIISSETACSIQVKTE